MGRHDSRKALHHAQWENQAPAWQSLVDAVERLARTESLAAVIEIVCAAARTVSGADGAAFLLRQDDSCYCAGENAIAPLWTGQHLPLSSTVAGWCMQHRQRAAISNIYGDDRVPHAVCRSTFAKSLLMVPVGEEAPLGAIGCYWAQTRYFSASEMALMDALARATSSAIAAIETREALRDSKERLSMALSAGRLQAWEIVFSRNQMITAPPLTESMGLEGGEPFSLDIFWGAIHPDDLAFCRGTIETARHSGAKVDIEFRVAWPSGRKGWLRMSGTRTYDIGGRPDRLAGVALDITERRRTKERLEGMQAEMAQLARLSEMGQMASMLAHELNQPLAAAGNYLGAARRQLGTPKALTERALETIDKARHQLDSLGEIIRRIRGFIGKTESVRAPESIAEVIAEALELTLLDPSHRGVAIRTELEDGLPLALIDKVQIQQVLVNLLRNAFEAMAERKPRRVMIAANAVADMIEIVVSDSGPGLAPDIRGRLFEPFVTSKHKGMGVGLSICRTLIEGQGGTMSGGTGPESGAAFRFTVPAVISAR